MIATAAKELTIKSLEEKKDITKRQKIVNRIYRKIEDKAKEGKFECSILLVEIGDIFDNQILDFLRNLGYQVETKKSLIRISWL